MATEKDKKSPKIPKPDPELSKLSSFNRPLSGKIKSDKFGRWLRKTNKISPKRNLGSKDK